MQCLDTRREDKDLEHRPGSGHSTDRATINLKGEPFRLLAVVLLEIVCSQHGLNQVDVGRQDPVFIKIGDPLQALVDLGTNLCDLCRPVALQIRVKAGLKQSDDPLDHMRITGQRINNVVLAVSKADLLEISVRRSQQGRLLPVELRS